MRCERDRYGGKGAMFLLDDFLYIIQFRKDNNPMKDCNNLLWIDNSNEMQLNYSSCDFYSNVSLLICIY